MNSRAKGARGERQLRDQFRAAGFIKAHRGQQFSGLQGNADVVVPELPTLHFEVKACQNTDLYGWMAQAVRDSRMANRLPVVCHRKNNSEWLAILRLEDLLILIKETDRIHAAD